MAHNGAPWPATLHRCPSTVARQSAVARLRDEHHSTYFSKVQPPSHTRQSESKAFVIAALWAGKHVGGLASRRTRPHACQSNQICIQLEWYADPTGLARIWAGPGK